MFPALPVLVLWPFKFTVRSGTFYVITDVDCGISFVWKYGLGVVPNSTKHLLNSFGETVLKFSEVIVR